MERNLTSGARINTIIRVGLAHWVSIWEDVRSSPRRGEQPGEKKACAYYQDRSWKSGSIRAIDIR